MTSKEIGTLVVVILKAKNLKDNHSFYKQDPYALVRLGGFGKTTKTDHRGGQHPVWDEEFHIPIYESTDSLYRTLKISCFSKEKKVDDPLGEGEVDITETLRKGEFDDWIPLKQEGQARGEVYLECTFYSAGPPVQRRPSKLQPWERTWRPPATPPKDHQSPASSAGSSPRHSPNRNPAPLPAQRQQHLTVPDTLAVPTATNSPPRVPSILRPANPRSSATPPPFPNGPDGGVGIASSPPRTAGRHSGEYNRRQDLPSRQEPPPQYEPALPNPFDPNPGPPLPARRQPPPQPQLQPQSQLQSHPQLQPQPQAQAQPQPQVYPAQQQIPRSQQRALSKIDQEQADREFAEKLAQSEGIDLDRLRALERDHELARRIAEDEENGGGRNHLPGAWNGSQ